MTVIFIRFELKNQIQQKMSLKFIFSLTLLIFFGGNTFAQTKQQTVTSKIEKVTVFASGAQVNRKTKFTIPQGRTELVFAGISPNIDKQSIQVKGDGNFTILSVIHQTNYLNEQKRREETIGLENQKEYLKQKLTFEKSMLTVFKNEENMLAKNQSIGGSNNGVKTLDLKEAVDFQRNRLTEVLLKQIEIDKNIQKLDSTIKKLDNQLKALNQRKDFATSEILVTVLSKEFANASFEISYFVKDAGWFANYDLRVKDISNPIDLTFKANVFQSSGEDWKDVKLTISNGNPTESGVAPTLQAWYLRFGYPKDLSQMLKGKISGLLIGGKAGEAKGKIADAETGEGIPGVNILIKGTTIGTVTDTDGNFSLQLPENSQTLVISAVGYATQELMATTNFMNITLQEDVTLLGEVVVVGYGVSEERRIKKDEKLKIKGTGSDPLETKETYQPTTLSFEIEIPYTILNDGKVYTVDIKNQSIPALYEYFAIPKLEKDAFLTAKIVDWQDLNLLEGEVNLFFEGAYLGKSILDVRNANDTLNISLGRDKGIIIERKNLKEFTNKQFLGNFKTENRSYEISIRNNKKQSINITIQDQFPISTLKEITVEEQEYKEAEIDKDTKILTWKDEIAPKQEKKHNFKYSVKYPKNQIVILE